jgi:hypothetical protein
VHPIEAVMDANGQRIWAAGDGTVTSAAAEVFASRAAAQWNA